ncbi:unnamed protein product, partial [Closterium sp. Naga37s-1]
MTCRRWNQVTRSVPALCLGSSAGGAAAANQAPYLTFEQDSTSGGASAQSPPPRHPREFIFEAWTRHVGPSLHSLTLSRALPPTNSAKRPRGNGTSGRSGGDGGGGSVVVTPNLWEEEDASMHLAHISRHCTNLRSLSLAHVSLSAPSLLATLKPMPALQHLSFSWLHASPTALHTVLDAAPNLRHLTIFMASGFPYLELRLPPSLQHLSLSYIRADSITLLSARSLQSLSIRDMFLSALTIRDAPNLRQLSVASANCLLVSAPHSSLLASIDLRAGSLNWPATETLISTNRAALETLSLDFFATTAPASAALAPPTPTKCDMSVGEWRYSKNYPRYVTCPYVRSIFNCRGNGRKDQLYEKQRWVPDKCSLPRFSAKAFLAMMRGKTVGFVGDSLMSNMWESFVCLLYASGVNLKLVQKRYGGYRYVGFYIPTSNTTIVYRFSAYLMRAVTNSTKTASGRGKHGYNVELDVIDPALMGGVTNMDVVVLTSGTWWQANVPGRAQSNVYRIKGQQVYLKDLNAHKYSLNVLRNFLGQF